MNSESYTRRGIFDPLIKNKLKVANIIPEWKYFLQSETPVQCTIRPSVVFLGEENRGCEMTHGTYGGRCREEGARVRLYTGDLSSAFSPILSISSKNRYRPYLEINGTLTEDIGKLSAEVKISHRSLWAEAGSSFSARRI